MKNCEDLWISLKPPGLQRNLIVGVIYRHPNGDVPDFIEALNNKISKMN